MSNTKHLEAIIDEVISEKLEGYVFASEDDFENDCNYELLKQNIIDKFDFNLTDIIDSVVDDEINMLLTEGALEETE